MFDDKILALKQRRVHSIINRMHCRTKDITQSLFQNQNRQPGNKCQ